MITAADITVEPIEVVDPFTRGRTAMFVAHGPGGHTWLLERMTAESARADGLAYFLSTRVLHNGRWYLSDEHGKPFADENGNRFTAQESR